VGSNIHTRQIPGVGPESAYVARLFAPDGSRRPFADVEAELGNRFALLVLLDHELGTRLSRPRARGYPPRLFISYRRESAAHIEWCINLAQQLEQYGYECVLDHFFLAGDDPEAIAAFIGRLGDADAAIVVVTPSYLRGDDPNSMRDWLFEEWERIQYLESWGVLEVVLAVRDGDPDQLWGGYSATRYAVVDLRPSAGDATPLLNMLGSYDGPRLSESARDELALGAARAVGAAMDNDVADVAPALEAIERFEGTEEHYLALLAFTLVNRSDDGITEPLPRPPMELSLASTVIAARLLWRFDCDVASFKLCAEAAEGASLWRNELHMLMGDMLVRFERTLDAINHFNWCARTHASEEMGAYWSSNPRTNAWAAARAARLWAELGDGTRFAAAISRALELDPESEEARDLASVFGNLPQGATNDASEIVECRECGALAYEPGAMCALCGTHGVANSNCVLCDAPVVARNELPYCPICRRGAGDDGEMHDWHLVEREIGGRYSVFA
jgi:hypothetical protein